MSYRLAAIWMQRDSGGLQKSRYAEREKKEKKRREGKRREKQREKKDLNAPLFALYDRYFPLRRIITDFNLISREVSE